jgi:hypothetical protein
MELPTVYVAPPNPALLCRLHFGVFKDPVTAPCGCTFCRRCIQTILEDSPVCPLDNTPITINELKPNSNVEARVNELLIHCRYGVRKHPESADWVVNPDGCKMWINLGNRKEHEAVCPHASKLEEDFEIIENEAQKEDKPVVPPIISCIHRENGCVFVGHTDAELAEHLGVCLIEKMARQIDNLHKLLAEKDEEIKRLNLLVEQERERAHGFRIKGEEILNSLSRGISKLDDKVSPICEDIYADSQRVLEEARVALQKTKESVKNSAVFQNSVQTTAVVLSSIKQAFEFAHAEIAAKLNELLRENPNTEIPGEMPSSTTTSTTTSTVEEPARQDNAVAGGEDEELKQFIKESEETYRKEQAMKANEEELVQQAIRLSLLEMASDKNKRV